MAKEAYYFSHDSNARHDPKIKVMRSVYRVEGYGWFWLLVEMMREADGYKLEMQGKYIWNAYALEMECTPEKAKEFIHDCIHEFGLFKTDEDYFWSESLLRRMHKREEVSQKRAAAAAAKWEKARANAEYDANAMQMHSNEDAIAVDNDALKESKGKEIKKLYGDHVLLTDSEHMRLVSEFGETDTQYWIDKINDWFIQNPKRLKNYSDHNRMIRSWKREDAKRSQPVPKTSSRTPHQLPLHVVSKEEEDEHARIVERIRQQNAERNRRASRNLSIVSSDV